MVLEAHAKINLTLKVLGVRPDGYHDLQSVVVPIPLADTLVLEEAGDIRIAGCGEISLEENLVYRAAQALRKATGCAAGVHIAVTKRIPLGAGLGGGSADAAAALRGLNELWHLGLSVADLCRLGAQVGSDVPSLVLGGPVMMEGRGERVAPLAGYPLPDLARLVLYTPPIHASTPAVYREFRETDRGCGANDLQPAACRLYPGILEALRKLECAGCRQVMMSGSGSTVFGWRVD